MGKTTTAVNVAAGLALRGKRVLLVDCDPQGNATSGLGIDKPNAKSTLYEVLAAWAKDTDQAAADKVTESTIINVHRNLDLIPSTTDLAGVEPVLHKAVGKEMILREALEPVRGNYDWIVLDAPPSLGLLTINILAAADKLLVPMQCEFYALEGLSQLLKTVEVVRKRINPSLQVGKVLLTLHDARNRLTQQVAKEVKDYFGTKVSDIVIPRNVKLSESPSFGEAAVVRFPSSKGAGAYLNFVDEVLKCAS